MPSKRSLSCLHFVHEIRRELGGVVAAALDVCQAMANRGHRVTIATCDASDAPCTSPNASGGELQIVEVRPSKLQPSAIGRKGLQLIEEIASATDVAHLHTPWYFGNVQLARLFNRIRLPYVLSVHGMLDHYSMEQKALKKRVYLRCFGQRLLENAARVHFTAEEERSQALHYASLHRPSCVLPCMVDLHAIDSLPGVELARQAFPSIRTSAFKILFLSRLHPKKGVDVLISAISALKQKSIDFQLLLAGPGEDDYVDSLKNLVRRLNLERDVTFLGMVQGATKASLYQLADVFILPTRQENFGLVLVEAMACGAVVVTTRGTDIWREIQQGGARIIDLNAEAIATELIQLASHDKPREDGVQSRKFIYEWLDPDRLAAAYEAMYFEAIADGAKSALIRA
jgi:glycosyltransferase involved in cell wall biosynthesis